MEPILGTERYERLAELRATVRRYEDRYGKLEGMVDLTKARSAMKMRQRRYDQLVEEYDRVRRQKESMESEIDRIEQWIEFCLESIIQKAKEDHAEGWSPTAVLGYRLWAVGKDGLHGVKMRWPGPTLEATCLSRGGDSEIPHTDGRCGRLGCGVYASKTVDPLYKEFDVSRIGDVALGLVALTGKVVEHDDGYRGAVATVIALGASLGHRLLLTSDPKCIAAVFEQPTPWIAKERRVETEEERLIAMEAFVTSEARRAEQWTLGTNNE